MPHFRLPALDHEVVSLVWAIVLGAYIYLGSVAVGVHSGTAFVVAGVSAFFNLAGLADRASAAAPCFSSASSRTCAGAGSRA